MADVEIASGLYKSRGHEIFWAKYRWEGIDEIFMMQQTKTIIIGAGPTGLSVAYHLNGDSIVLESTNQIGGLCRSFEIEGVIFDIGGHSYHSTYNRINSFISEDLGVEMYFQKRDARILFKDSIIPYPWQRFFHLVRDKKVVEDCYEGLRTRGCHDGQANLKNLLLARYGNGITKHFLFPYNEKLWMRDLEEISSNWASERIVDSGEGKVAGAQRLPLYENSIVGYPSKGGFDEIFKKMASKIRDIRFEKHVCHIDTDKKILMTRRGDVFKWERIVSTIPIPDMFGMLKNSPYNFVRLASELLYVSLQVDFFVTGEPLGCVPQRLYCADAELPAHKIAFNSLSSENEASKNHHSIITETSIDDPSVSCCRERTARILKGLYNTGIIKKQASILKHRYQIVKYAYPVQCHRHVQIKNLLTRYLELQGIYSIGRFGNWEYINSDQCLLRGEEIAQRLS